MIDKKYNKSDYFTDDKFHPVNFTSSSLVWITNQLKDDKMTVDYALNFCSHGWMVGKPRASKERKDGAGCRCQTEEWVDKYGWPKGVDVRNEN